MSIADVSHAVAYQVQLHNTPFLLYGPQSQHAQVLSLLRSLQEVEPSEGVLGGEGQLVLRAMPRMMNASAIDDEDLSHAAVLDAFWWSNEWQLDYVLWQHDQQIENRLTIVVNGAPLAAVTNADRSRIYIATSKGLFEHQVGQQTSPVLRHIWQSPLSGATFIPSPEGDAWLVVGQRANDTAVAIGFSHERGDTPGVEVTEHQANELVSVQDASVVSYEHIYIDHQRVQSVQLQGRALAWVGDQQIAIVGPSIESLTAELERPSNASDNVRLTIATLDIMTGATRVSTDAQGPPLHSVQHVHATHSPDGSRLVVVALSDAAVKEQTMTEQRGEEGQDMAARTSPQSDSAQALTWVVQDVLQDTYTLGDVTLHEMIVDQSDVDTRRMAHEDNMQTVWSSEHGLLLQYAGNAWQLPMDQQQHQDAWRLVSSRGSVSRMIAWKEDRALAQVVRTLYDARGQERAQQIGWWHPASVDELWMEPSVRWVWIQHTN